MSGDVETTTTAALRSKAIFSLAVSHLIAFSIYAMHTNMRGRPALSAARDTIVRTYCPSSGLDTLRTHPGGVAEYFVKGSRMNQFCVTTALLMA